MLPLALEARGLVKAFGALVVTKDVNLSLAVGARHALIGPNGAGKTTLVHILSGIVRPDAGTVSILGQDASHEGPARRTKRGLVRTFQVSSLFPRLSILENVFLAVSEHAGESLDLWRAAGHRRRVIERAQMLIEQMGLGDDMHRRIAETSYGKQRLVEIAIAIALEPKVLLLDEPAAGIPSNETEALLGAIEALPKDIAILMIEHDMQMVHRFASEVSVLVNGSVLMTGSPHQVMSSPEVRTVYLGSMSERRFETKMAGA